MDSSYGSIGRDAFTADSFTMISPQNPQASTSPEISYQSSNMDQTNSPPNQVHTSRSSGSPPTRTNTASYINPRSCTTCRKRKVRCDKTHPCSNCSKAGIECVFPGPGRAPRRSKKPPDTELLARLRRLEGVVQSLGKGIDGEELEMKSEETKDKEGVPDQKPLENHCPDRGDRGVLAPSASKPDCPKKSTKWQEAEGLSKEFGHLVVSDGRSRYVSNRFWSSLTEEVAEMRDILDDPTDEEEDYPSPESDGVMATNHQSFIFGFSSTMITLRILHPSAKLILAYWEIFKERVDPLVKLLHRGTTEALLAEASKNLEHIPKVTEAMMFAIYYSTVTSLSSEECRAQLQIDKDVALKRYRFGVEQALARAGFLDSQELMLLQVFVLFLVSVRRHDDTRFPWTLTGLAIRIANSQGIHRDSAQFGLNPFDIEMRRRLWWQVCTLDVRTSEDQGSDPFIMEQTFDTKLPLNVNDEDIWPGMTEAPKKREGFTDMTFCLIRYEIGFTIRSLNYKPPGPMSCPKRWAGVETMEDRERKIEKLRKHLEDEYLQYCDINIPFQYVCFHVAKLVMAKMWLIVHHPLGRRDGGAGIPPESKDRLFRTSIDIVHHARILELQKETVKWGWLFRTYVQWHAVAYILSELCSRTKGKDVDNAWVAVNGVFQEWGGTVAAGKKGMLWKPMRRLMEKARAVRKKELEKSILFPTDGSLGRIDMAQVATPMQMSSINLNGSMSAKSFSPMIPNSPILSNNLNHDNVNMSAPLMDCNGTQPFGTAADSTYFGGVPIGMDQWMFNESANQSPLTPHQQFEQQQNQQNGTFINDEDALNWSGWDDMVKDFPMNGQQELGFESGQVINEMGDWW